MLYLRIVNCSKRLICSVWRNTDEAAASTLRWSAYLSRALLSSRPQLQQRHAIDAGPRRTLGWCVGSRPDAVLQGLTLAAKSSAQAACTRPLLGQGHKLTTDLQHESEHLCRPEAALAGLALAATCSA